MKLGLMLQVGGGTLEGGKTPRWPDLRDMALAAEAVGFDTLFVPDHLLFRQSPTDNAIQVEMPAGKTRGAWEAWTVLCALAAATSRIELGPFVACNSFRNPALLAKMAVTLDEVSDGRLVLGIGAGWHEPEYHAFGYPYDHRVGRFEEALQIIAPLLREGRVDFEGRYYQARDCEIAPRGPRPAGPPILIGAQRPRMMRLAARFADIYDTDFHLEADAVAERLQAFESACAKDQPRQRHVVPCRRHHGGAVPGWRRGWIRPVRAGWHGPGGPPGRRRRADRLCPDLRGGGGRPAYVDLDRSTGSGWYRDARGCRRGASIAAPIPCSPSPGLRTPSAAHPHVPGASTPPRRQRSASPRPIKRARTEHRDTLPATQFDGEFPRIARTKMQRRGREPDRAQPAMGRPDEITYLAAGEGRCAMRNHLWVQGSARQRTGHAASHRWPSSLRRLALPPGHPDKRISPRARR